MYDILHLMAYLVLIRHGQSLWNAQGKWTGWTDISLSETGIKEAIRSAGEIKDIKFDEAFTSKLKRAQETLAEIKTVLHYDQLPTQESEALNERNYGDLTGKNKWEIQKEYGQEKFIKLRRGWDTPITNGETLKDVYNRVVPYYEKNIIHDLQTGKNVLIVAHGNSLRALVKYLEGLSDTDVEQLNIGTGEIYIYQVDAEGGILSKEIRATNQEIANL